MLSIHPHADPGDCTTCAPPSCTPPPNAPAWHARHASTRRSTVTTAAVQPRAGGPAAARRPCRDGTARAHGAAGRSGLHGRGRSADRTWRVPRTRRARRAGLRGRRRAETRRRPGRPAWHPRSCDHPLREHRSRRPPGRARRAARRAQAGAQRRADGRAGRRRGRGRQDPAAGGVPRSTPRPTAAPACSPGSAWSWARRACRSRRSPRSLREIAAHRRAGPPSTATSRSSPACCPSWALPAGPAPTPTAATCSTWSAALFARLADRATAGAGHRGPALGRPLHPRPDRLPGPRRPHRPGPARLHLPHRRAAPRPPAAPVPRRAGPRPRRRADRRSTGSTATARPRSSPTCSAPSRARGPSTGVTSARRATRSSSRSWPPPAIPTACADIPESLRDLLLARVDRLPETAQPVLRIAAAGGTRIAHELLAEVAGLPGGRSSTRRCARRSPRSSSSPTPTAGTSSATPWSARRCTTTCCPASTPGCTPATPPPSRPRRTWSPPGRAPAEIAHHWYAAHDHPRALVAAARRRRRGRPALRVRRAGPAAGAGAGAVGAGARRRRAARHGPPRAAGGDAGRRLRRRRPHARAEPDPGRAGRGRRRRRAAARRPALRAGAASCSATLGKSDGMAEICDRRTS